PALAPAPDIGPPALAAAGKETTYVDAINQALGEEMERDPSVVLMGQAIGAAILGLKPVIEMQFGDFVTCGFNQLVNVAAKLYYRWQVPCPIVVRCPSGGGVGAGPFHSQNPEGWFAHTAGLKVVCPATAADAMGLLKAAIRDPNPVMVFEHKFLYR